MSKSKELRILVDKTKKDIVDKIDKIVYWNLDNSPVIDQFKGEDFTEVFADASNYIKKTIMEELFHEYTLQTRNEGDNIIK